MKPFFFLLSLLFSYAGFAQAPLRVGVAGLTHDHVHGILGRANKGDIEIVGIAESDPALIKRYQQQYNLPDRLFYPTLEAMVSKTRPEAVCAFNSIYEHLQTVQYCAPRGIHVMVEKPLAVNLDHARQMEKLARQHKIYLLTNYETTWYPSNQQVYQMIHEQRTIGDIRKVVVHDGHPGPKEIGCSKEFLAWLTDPKMNGGGAIIDFGCYGADLMSWLMKGERPTSVTAITQQIKPDVYPKVDDEATIVVTYPTAQAIIQGSWNWPVSRKDMEVYGKTGYLFADNRSQIRYRPNEKAEEEKLSATPLSAPQDDPFAYFAGVVRGSVSSTDDLSSLKINMVAMEILDAAVRSAREGKTVKLK